MCLIFIFLDFIFRIYLIIVRVPNKESRTVHKKTDEIKRGSKTHVKHDLVHNSGVNKAAKITN